MRCLHVWKMLSDNYYRRWHIIHAYRWKCAHWCRFPPFVPRSAPVPSVTSQWLPCSCNPPYGHSSQCHSNAESGPWSVTVMPSLCVCILIFWSVCVLLNACVCVHSCMLLFFLFLEKAWQIFFFVFSLSEGAEMWRCVAVVTQREETKRVDRERSGGEVRRSSAATAAAATGRGQRGWQCLLVASLSTWLSLNPAWRQRRVTQHARWLLRGVK